MENNTPPAMFQSGDDYGKLAQWLQQVMAQTPTPASGPLKAGQEVPHFALSPDDYHPRFYQQLPDFVMALLAGDAQAASRYAPLLYHLIGCPACHAAYLDLYDSLRFAVQVDEGQPQTQFLAPQTGLLAGMPSVRLYVLLCQLLVSQAEAVLKQAHHDHRDEIAAARDLLRLAIDTSTHIEQSAMRTRALHDLVRVATLSNPEPPQDQGPATHAYAPSLAGAGGGARHGHKATVRKAGLPQHAETSEQPVIYLQDRGWSGTITQQGDTLLLHLRDLDSALRGHFVTIAVPLGSLIEPIHWVGGNPQAIQSTAAVDAQGNLTTLLGHTELRLDNAQDRSLLEITFMRVEIRTA